MGAVSKNFDEPDDTRDIPSGKVEGVHLAGERLARLTFQPGWRWSESLKPIVGGELCQAHHVGYALAGSLRVAAGDGTETDIAAGDAYVIEPDHDAWVVGDATFEALEFDRRTVEVLTGTD